MLSHNGTRPVSDDIESGVDLEHLDQAVRSRGYAFIRGRMLQVVEGCRDKLEVVIEPENAAFTRGFVAGVRRCLEIPKILQAEFVAKEKQG